MSHQDCRATPDPLFTADSLNLNIEDTMKGGRITLDSDAQTVTRRIGGVNTEDQYSSIEVIIGTLKSDRFNLAGPQGGLERVYGDEGKDRFDAGRSGDIEGGEDLYTEGPQLYGGKGDDDFNVSALYDIFGGAGDDTVDLSITEGVQWYVEFNIFSAFDRSEDEDDVIRSEALQAVFGDAEQNVASLKEIFETRERFDPQPSLPFDPASVMLEGVETLIGGNRNDVFFANGGLGGGDLEVVYGGLGDDLLGDGYVNTSGDGPDDPTNQVGVSLFGGGGNDFLFGANALSISLFGGDGDDRLDASQGIESSGGVLHGGAGSDVFYLTYSPITVYGGTPDRNGVTDEVDLNGTPDDPDDDERFVDVVDFSNGLVDTRSALGSAGQGFVIDLRDGNESGPTEVVLVDATQFLFGIENAIGTDRSDIIYGNERDNILLGGVGRTGSDLIYGGEGDDIIVSGGGVSVHRLFGGLGDDVLFLDARPDRLSPGFSQQPDKIFGGDDSLTNGDATSPFSSDGSTGLAGDILSFASNRPDATGGTTVGVSPLSVTINLAVPNPRFSPLYNPVSFVRYDEGTKGIDVVGIEHIVGSSGADSLTGDDGINVLTGEGGDDTIDGGGNDDILNGGSGADEVYGGAGNDTVIGSSGNDTLSGGAETEGTSDLLDFSGNILGLVYDSDAGTVVSDWQDEDGVDFTSTATFENFEAVIGGSGDDTFQVANDTIRLDGGAGTDQLSFFGLGAGVTVDLDSTTDSFEGFEDLRGTDEDDVLTGDGFDNVLSGERGKDVLYGGEGNDTLIGGRGSDAMYGGVGADTVSYADSGAVTVLLNENNLSGGRADGDTIFSIENVIGSSSSDSIVGDGNANTLNGGGGNDVIDGGGGEDLLIVSDLTDGTLSGGDGKDTLQIDDNGDVKVVLELNELQIAGGTVAVEQIENVTTADGNDDVRGNASSNIFITGSGQDKAFGKGGADTFILGSGNDKAYAGGGSDTVHGENGADDLFGGGGNDLLYGGNGNDELEGRAGNDTLFGGDGDDILTGGDGDNTLNGGNGVDRFVIDLGLDGTTVIEDFELATRVSEDDEIEEIIYVESNPDDLIYTDVAGGPFGDGVRVEDATKIGQLFLVGRQANDFVRADRAEDGSDSNAAPTNSNNSVAVVESPSIAIDLSESVSDDGSTGLTYAIVDPSSTSNTQTGKLATADVSASSDPAGSATQAEIDAILAALEDLIDTIPAIVPYSTIPAFVVDAFTLLDGTFRIEEEELIIEVGDLLDFLPQDLRLDFTFGIQATDAFGATSNVSELEVIVEGRNNAPVFVSPDVFIVSEGTLDAAQIQATDPDLTEVPSFEILGGSDAALFDLDTDTGQLAFVSVSDFDAPEDADGDNIYELVVGASDGFTTTQQAITVQVSPQGLVGSTDADTLTGTEESERLDALGGDDTYRGNGGADQFVLGSGDRDRVRDFNASEGDLIDVSAWGVQSFDELRIDGKTGKIRIRDSELQERARIEDADRNLRPEDLTADNFIFAELSGRTLDGTDARDLLVGFASDDLIDGAGAADIYIGGDGSDTFVFGAGTDGRDRVLDFQDGLDQLDLSSWGVVDTDALRFVDKPAGRVLILDDNGNVADIRSLDSEFSSADLGASDILFSG